MFREAASIEELEAELADHEFRIALLRAEQVVLVQRAEWAQATQSDGSRSMEEWVQARLDVRPDVARDLAGLSRLKARQRRMTTADERSLFTDRYFVVQPSLDDSTYRMWGQVPGVMGRAVEKAITQRADELRLIGDSTGVSSTRGQRQADALVAIAQDSLDSEYDTGAAPSRTMAPAGNVTVFVDASGTNAAETGAEIMYGPRVGPNTLEAMLCGGAAVNVVGLQGGVPVVTGRASRAIPSAIRQRVAQRDAGCTIDGCASRYRLQPHHIIRVADGGTNDIDNLTTLCWYHHHVAIHGYGYRIDPESPSHRRRLSRCPTGNRGPPPRSPDPG